MSISYTYGVERRDKGRVAVTGCTHGELDATYRTIRELEARTGIKVDLLIACGDFQAVRNADDLMCMAVPPKYRSMLDFHKYYSGSATASTLTVFIGGNHEASNHAHELRYGGWAAPGIYYLGRAGVVRFAGLRLAALSGTYIEHDFRRPHDEAPPYPGRQLKSAYHVRAVDVARLGAIRARPATTRMGGGPEPQHEPISIALSHDWPSWIAFRGDKDALLRKKKFLRAEIEDGRLGSPASAALLSHLRPAYWFAAHMHVRFPALVRHDDRGRGDGADPAGKPEGGRGSGGAPGGDPPGSPQAQQAKKRTRVGERWGEEAFRAGVPTPPLGSASSPDGDATRFLALDKCLPGRPFLQLIDVPWADPDDLALSYDAEWLEILRSTQRLGAYGVPFPPHLGPPGSVPPSSPAAVAAIAESFARANGGSLAIPTDAFVRTAKVYTARGPEGGGGCGGRGGRGGRGGQRPRSDEGGRVPPRPVENPQTSELLRKLGAEPEDAWGRVRGVVGRPVGRPPALAPRPLPVGARLVPTSVTLAATADPAEIDLDDETAADPAEIALDDETAADPAEIALDDKTAADPAEIALDDETDSSATPPVDTSFDVTQLGTMPDPAPMPLGPEATLPVLQNILGKRGSG